MKWIPCFSIAVDNSVREIDPSSLLSIFSKKNLTSSFVILGWICLKNYENWLKLSSWYPLKPRLSSKRLRSMFFEFIWNLSSVITIFSLSSKFWFCSAYLWKYPWKIGCKNTSSHDNLSFSWTFNTLARKSLQSWLKEGLIIRGLV